MNKKPEQSVERQVPEMKTELTLVSFVLAKLLKEAGFDWRCRDSCFSHADNGKKLKEPYYIEWKGIKESPLTENEYFAPTLALAEMWFRNVHNIDINVQKHSFQNLEKVKWVCFVGKDILRNSNNANDYKMFATCELAQEAGLIQSCKYRISQLNKK